MWRVVVESRANRSVRRFPATDRERIARAVAQLTHGPLLGDVRKLDGNAYRLRVGSYRVCMTIDFAQQAVTVTDVLRRTSTTY
jgi:mRNA-degrading endonuclease RelE of RelBE toxin-antitoxin system